MYTEWLFNPSLYPVHRSLWHQLQSVSLRHSPGGGHDPVWWYGSWWVWVAVAEFMELPEGPRGQFLTSASSSHENMHALHAQAHMHSHMCTHTHMHIHTYVYTQAISPIVLCSTCQTESYGRCWNELCSILLQHPGTHFRKIRFSHSASSVKLAVRTPCFPAWHWLVVCIRARACVCVCVCVCVRACVRVMTKCVCGTFVFCISCKCW